MHLCQNSLDSVFKIYSLCHSSVMCQYLELLNVHVTDEWWVKKDMKARPERWRQARAGVQRCV